MEKSERFESLAAKRGKPSLAAEMWEFLRVTRKWWLLPVFITLLLFALFIVLAASGAAPFIYTLF